MTDEDDLQKLISELNSDPLPQPMLPAPNPPKPKGKGGGSVELDEPIKIAKTVVQPVAPSKPVEDITTDIKAMLGKYKDVFEDVLDQCKSDRSQVQDVVNHFLDVVNHGGKVPTVYIEKFPELLKTKNDIAVTAIKAMDSLSKLVAASKNSQMLQSVNVNFDIESLTKLLEEPNQ